MGHADRGERFAAARIYRVMTAADREPASLPAGARIAGYEVVRCIGSGGFGEVYEAAAGGARVAIKVLRAASREDAARFAREIRCVALLEHPNTPRLLELGELPDGRPYYAMELLDGETLAERVERRGPLPLGEVAAMVRVLAGVLEAAHARGIVHRDVKPSNVVLADRPVLLDFGVAKLLDDTNPPLTRSQTIVGSPMTMAPEQLRGGPIDARADVYGLGVVAYFALCGRLPFRHADPAILEALVLSGEPPPVGRQTSAPLAIDGVLRRALAKDPAARPASAAAFADELEHAARGDDAIAVFVELRPARPEDELDDDELARLDALLETATGELAAHGLVVDAVAQDSVLLLGYGRASGARLERVVEAAQALVARRCDGGELAVTVARGAAEQLRVVSSWLPASRSSGVVLTSPRSHGA